MKLISQLNEASDISVTDLKAVMKKDKRVNKIFTKDLQLDEISNLKEFIDTLRYYLLNNRNVMAFVKARGPGSERVSPFWFDRARAYRAETMTQNELNTIGSEVSSIFRDVTAIQSTNIRTATMNAMWDFLDNVKSHNFNSQEAAELFSMPNIRPRGAIRVYRGINFNEQSLIEKEDIHGKMTLGSGLKFLKSIRAGKRVVDLDWDKYSIWTTSKEHALRYAYHGSEGSYLSARKLKNSLGFVISTLAEPSSILVQVNLLPKVKPQEQESVILVPGTYTARLVHKFTPDGEVDPTAKAASSDASEVVEDLELFAHVFKLPTAKRPDFESMERGNLGQALDSLQELNGPAMKAKILKSYSLLQDYYNTQLKGLDDNDLNSLAADNSTAVSIIKEIRKYMEENLSIDANKSAQNRFGNTPRHELGAGQVYDNTNYISNRESMVAIAANVRFTQWSSASGINNLRRAGGTGTYDSDLHRKGGKIQQAAMEEAIDGFYKIIDKPRPAGRDAAVKEMIATTFYIERNAKLLSDLWRIRESLDRLAA
jgi:hypothetical protein